jgi:hypothetical protein
MVTLFDGWLVALLAFLVLLSWPRSDFLDPKYILLQLVDFGEGMYYIFLIRTDDVLDSLALAAYY